MKHEPIETIEYRGCKISLFREENPESPRDWDNVGKMACWHRRYTLGDVQPNAEPLEYLADLTSKETKRKLEYLENCTAEKSYSLKQWDKVNAAIERAKQKLIEADLAANLLILPLYLYDHSGLAIRTGPFSDPWDSGRLGIIHCSLKKAHHEWGDETNKTPSWNDPVKYGDETITLKEAATRCLNIEVATYNAFIQGDVIGYVAEDWDGEDIDSCWGFFPDEREGYGKRWDYPISQAKSAIDHHIEHYGGPQPGEHDTVETEEEPAHA